MEDNDYIGNHETDTLDFIQRSGNTGLPFSVYDCDMLDDDYTGPTAEPFDDGELRKYELIPRYERELSFEEIVSGMEMEYFRVMYREMFDDL